MGTFCVSASRFHIIHLVCCYGQGGEAHMKVISKNRKTNFRQVRGIGLSIFAAATTSVPRPVRQGCCARRDHLTAGWLSSNFAASLRGVEIKGPLRALWPKCAEEGTGMHVICLNLRITLH